MPEQTPNIPLIRQGFPQGIITDGDPMTRPAGSCSILENADFDIENGVIPTRNPVVASTLLAGLNIPSGYAIMDEGIFAGSFNAPIDRQVIIVVCRNPTTQQNKIYVNVWFNPPAANTDPVGSNNDYENYVSSKAANTWFNEWIELTETIALSGFVKTGTLTFKVTAGSLSADANKYRGWFVWNKTKWNSGATYRIKNESFVCIEAYVSAAGDSAFTIQNRF